MSLVKIAMNILIVHGLRNRNHLYLIENHLIIKNVDYYLFLKIVFVTNSINLHP